MNMFTPRSILAALKSAFAPRENAASVSALTVAGFYVATALATLFYSLTLGVSVRALLAANFVYPVSYLFLLLTLSACAVGYHCAGTMESGRTQSIDKGTI